MSTGSSNKHGEDGSVAATEQDEATHQGTPPRAENLRATKPIPIPTRVLTSHQDAPLRALSPSTIKHAKQRQHTRSAQDSALEHVRQGQILGRQKATRLPESSSLLNASPLPSQKVPMPTVRLSRHATPKHSTAIKDTVLEVEQQGFYHSNARLGPQTPASQRSVSQTSELPRYEGLETIPLGPFELEQPIGRGGMGEVWSGVHREQGVPVAVKVMTHQDVHLDQFRMAFRNEVRAVAGLHHPSIVMVFDYGEIPQETEAYSGGRLRQGAPYLVMEKAESTLHNRQGSLEWNQLYEILLCLLDALAHAHARGVIHRDLKPANILEGGHRSGIKLTDFGLAQALDREVQANEQRELRGTPAFMAPEQFQGRWRDYGPWTDLYALGCVAFALASGAPPFGTSRSIGEMMRMHKRASLPPLNSVHPIPDGFFPWLQRMTAISPEHRYLRAADAASMLMDLNGEYLHSQAHHHHFLTQPSIPSTEAELPLEEEKHTKLQLHPQKLMTLNWLRTSTRGSEEQLPAVDMVSSIDQTVPPTTKIEGASDCFSDPGPTANLGPVEAPRRQPSSQAESSSVAQPQLNRRFVEPALSISYIPEQWQRNERPQASLRLLGAGLGLYGLRTIPFVDRERERQLMWNLLHYCHEEQQPSVLHLHGHAGCGKSRLAQWLCERAHETGAANYLKATHTERTQDFDSLRQMLGRHLRCQGLERPALEKRLCQLLKRRGVNDQKAWQSLGELLKPIPLKALQTETPIVFHSLKKQYQLLLGELCALAKERPLVLWLDDIHWSLDSLQFVKFVLEECPQAPLLFVLTARDDILADRPAEGQLFHMLQDHEHITQLDLEIEPLAPRYREELIRGLLGLDAELARQVEERTAGNPLFAVQLVGDWVQRGLLEPGERGFRLKGGQYLSVPDNIHHVWMARLSRRLRKRPASTGWALEIAAVLGQEVQGEEWRAACEREGIQAPFDLIEELLKQRLARCHDEGPTKSWSFEHNMLRESLVRNAQQADRWDTHNRACAWMLRKRSGTDVVERLGRHLLAAQELEAALEPLMLGAQARVDSGDYKVAESLLHDLEYNLNALQLPEWDVRWGRFWLLHSQIERYTGHMQRAQRWATLAERFARRYQWPVYIRIRALLEQGMITWRWGHSEWTSQLLIEAESLSYDNHDHQQLGACRFYLGELALRRGMLVESYHYLQQALQDYELVGETVGIGRCLISLCRLAMQAGHLDEASHHLERARLHFLHEGSRRWLADCLNTLGDVRRLQDRLPEAEESYREALHLYRSIGASYATVCEVNLCLILLEQEQAEDAKGRLRGALRTFSNERHSFMLGATHLALLYCATLLEDWQDWDRHFPQALVHITETGFKDFDVARMAENAGHRLEAIQQTERARAVYQLARQQWQELGHQDRAEQMSRTLQDLS